MKKRGARRRWSQSTVLFLACMYVGVRVLLLCSLKLELVYEVIAEVELSFLSTARRWRRWRRRSEASCDLRALLQGASLTQTVASSQKRCPPFSPPVGNDQPSSVPVGCRGGWGGRGRRLFPIGSKRAIAVACIDDADDEDGEDEFVSRVRLHYTLAPPLNCSTHCTSKRIQPLPRASSPQHKEKLSSNSLDALLGTLN